MGKWQPQQSRWIARLPTRMVREIQQKTIGIDPPLNAHRKFKVKVWDDSEQFYSAFAREMTKRVLSAFTEKHKIWMIAPTGPVPQWAIFAENLNAYGRLFQDFSLDHVHIVMMDDYADPLGRTPSMDVLGSFQNTIRVRFWDQLDKKIRMPWEKILFPTGERVEEIPQKIIDGGSVVDVVYGGIGWGLHFAFVDREAFTSERWANGDISKWKKLRALKAIELDASTIYQNALHTWGSNQWAVPSHANTIGPALILGDEDIEVKYRSFWCDGLCAGPEMTWQQMAVHVALYAPPNPEMPATFLKTLPGEINVMAPLDRPISVIPR